VWANGVVVSPPAPDDHLGLLERVEDLPVQEFVAQLGVEALAVPVLPGAAWLDVGRLRTYGPDPFADGLGDELGAMIGADVPGCAAQDERVRERVDGVHGLGLAAHPDRQALAGELVDDVEHPELPPVVGAVLDEVIGPDVVWALRPEPDARAVIEPEPGPPGLLGRHLQPLSPPEALDALDVHRPALRVRHRRDPAVAVPTVLERKPDDGGGESRLVGRRRPCSALRGPMLAEGTTGKALRHAVLGNNVVHAGPAAIGSMLPMAHQFPEAASLRISFSSVRSDTARRSLAFSASSSFGRFTWSDFRPPNSRRQR
jgi:hypothetical protein